MSQTAKNAKVAKTIHWVFLPFLAILAFLAVQIVRRSNCVETPDARARVESSLIRRIYAARFGRGDLAGGSFSRGEATEL